MTIYKLLAGAVLALCLFPCAVHGQAPAKVQFISVEEARSVLSAMSGALPAELKTPATQDPALWPTSCS